MYTQGSIVEDNFKARSRMFLTETFNLGNHDYFKAWYPYETKVNRYIAMSIATSTISVLFSSISATCKFDRPEQACILELISAIDGSY